MRVVPSIENIFICSGAVVLGLGAYACVPYDDAVHQVAVTVECSPGTTPSTPHGDPYDGITSITCMDGIEEYFQPREVISDTVGISDKNILASYVISCVDLKSGAKVTPLVTDNLSAGDPTRYSVFCPWVAKRQDGTPPISPTIVGH